MKRIRLANHIFMLERMSVKEDEHARPLYIKFHYSTAIRYNRTPVPKRIVDIGGGKYVNHWHKKFWPRWQSV